MIQQPQYVNPAYLALALLRHQYDTPAKSSLAPWAQPHQSSGEVRSPQDALLWVTWDGEHHPNDTHKVRASDPAWSVKTLPHSIKFPYTKPHL